MLYPNNRYYQIELIVERPKGEQFIAVLANTQLSGAVVLVANLQK